MIIYNILLVYIIQIEQNDLPVDYNSMYLPESLNLVDHKLSFLLDPI